MNTHRTEDRCALFAAGYSPGADQSLAAGVASIELMRVRGGPRSSLWAVLLVGAVYVALRGSPASAHEPATPDAHDEAILAPVLDAAPALEQDNGAQPVMHAGSAPSGSGSRTGGVE